MAIAIKSGLSYQDFIAMPFSLLMPLINELIDFEKTENKLEKKKVNFQDIPRISKKQKEKMRGEKCQNKL